MYNLNYLKEYLDIAPKISLGLVVGNKVIDDDSLIQLIHISVYYYRINMSSYFGCLDSGLL